MFKLPCQIVEVFDSSFILMYAFKQYFSLPGNGFQFSTYISFGIKSLIIVKHSIVGTGRYKTFNLGAAVISVLPRHLSHLQ